MQTVFLRRGETVLHGVLTLEMSCNPEWFDDVLHSVYRTVSLTA